MQNLFLYRARRTGLRLVCVASLGAAPSCGDDSTPTGEQDTSALADTAEGQDIPAAADVGGDPTDTAVDSSDVAVAPSWPAGPYGFAVDETIPETASFVDPADGSVRAFSDYFGHPEARFVLWYSVEGWCLNQCKAPSQALIDFALAHDDVAVLYTLNSDVASQPLWQTEAGHDKAREFAASWATAIAARSGGDDVLAPFAVLVDPDQLGTTTFTGEVAPPFAVVIETSTMKVRGVFDLGNNPDMLTEIGTLVAE